MVLKPLFFFIFNIIAYSRIQHSLVCTMDDSSEYGPEQMMDEANERANEAAAEEQGGVEAAGAEDREEVADEGDRQRRPRGRNAAQPRRGHQIRTTDENRCKIFVGNLSLDTTARDLMRYFRRFCQGLEEEYTRLFGVKDRPAVVDACIIRKFDAKAKRMRSRGCGFVMFSSNWVAMDAIAESRHNIRGRC